MTTTHTQFTRLQVSIALSIGSIALLILGLQPILLGELVDRGALSLEGVGAVAMGEIIAIGIGVALCDAWVPVGRYRLAAAVAALLAALGSIATPYAQGDAQFLLVRAFCGLAEGAMVWSTTSIIVRTALPDRNAAIFMVVQTLAQAALAAILALVIVPALSWQGGFATLAVLAALAAALSAILSKSLTPLAAPSDAAMKWVFKRMVPLGVAFCQMAALSSVWAYLEQLGQDWGFSAPDAQLLTAAVLTAQVIGGIAAIVLVRRFAVAATLIAGNAVLAAIMSGFWLLPAGNVVPFAVLCLVYGFAWLFLMPFHISLAFRVDAAGRVAMLVPAAQLVGSAIGPLVASLLISGEDASAVPLVGLGFALAAILFALAGSHRLRLRRTLT